MENNFEFPDNIYLQIENDCSDAILNSGANYYNNKEYDKAIRYYQIASSMGNIIATSNLGYCYYYGRNVQKNYSIAAAYWKIAAIYGDINALYKLGDMYINGIYFKQDINLGLNYYLDAYNKAKEYGELENIPDVCYRLGKESLPNGHLEENLDLAKEFLLLAKSGFEIRATYDDKVKGLYNSVNDLLKEFFQEDS